MGYKISSGYRTPRSRQRKRDRKSVCDPFYSEAKFFETGIFTSLPKTVFFFATILKCNERQNEKIGILVLITSSKTVRNLHLLLAKLCESYRDGKTSCHWQCWEKWDFLVKNDPQCMPICQHPPPLSPQRRDFLELIYSAKFVLLSRLTTLPITLQSLCFIISNGFKCLRKVRTPLHWNDKKRSYYYHPVTKQTVEAANIGCMRQPLKFQK